MIKSNNHHHGECDCGRDHGEGHHDCTDNHTNCAGEAPGAEDEMREFRALYLLPDSYAFSADRQSICDSSGRPLEDDELKSLRAEMVIGLGALQPLFIVAQLADGTFDFADNDEVSLQTSNGQEVGFYYEPDYNWSGVEGREFTNSPVTVTATWLRDSSMQASATITVAPIKELLWMPALEYAIAEDGRAFVDSEGRRFQSLPTRQALKVGQTYALQAVALYSDNRYRLMSRTELECVVLEDAVTIDYNSDDDVYLVKLNAPIAEPAEIMLVSLASDELMGSFYIIMNS